MFDPARACIERGQLLAEVDIVGKEYRRFDFTETGISLRLPLGTIGAVFWNTGDEHNEYGHITEEPMMRTRMVEKRMKKLETADREMPVEERISMFGNEDAEVTIVNWGSPKGAIMEAMELLREEGYRMNFLQVRMPHPLPTDGIAKVLRRSSKKIAIEGNYSGQLAGIIREKTGIQMDHFILKWNGRPMSTDEVYEALKSIMQNKAKERQVLTGGSLVF